MADIVVSQLSDSDLREKLISFGQNVGPVTSTTRKILERKLEKLIHASLAVENNVDSSAKKKVPVKSTRKSGRVTSRRKFAPFSSDEEGASNHEKISKETIDSSYVDFGQINDSKIADTSSTESQVGQISRNTRNRRRSSQNTLGSMNSNITASTPISTEIQKRKPLRNDFSDDDFPTIQGNIKLSTSIGTSPVQNSVGAYRNKDLSNHTNNIDTSVSDSYTRLAPSTPELSRQLSSSIRDEIDASLLKIRNSYSTRRPSPTKNQTVFEKYKQEKEEEEEEEEELEAEFVPNKISFTKLIKDSLTSLRVIPLLLVILLVGLYFYNGDDGSLPSISGRGNPNVNEEGEKKEIVNCLYQKLCVLAGKAECGYIESKWVKKDDWITFAASCLKNKESHAYTDPANIAKENGNYFKLNSEGDVSSNMSHKSLYCRISQAISVIMIRILMILVVLALIVGGYFILKKRWHADDEETRMIFHFVERIIETLQRHHEVCLTNKDLPPYLPIPHVRDMLIPLVKRKQMSKVWRKAVAFLNSSDSRIRVETQRIAGEDFDVWRWIGVCTPKMKQKKATNENYLSNEQEKCWQGPAFDEIEKVVRMPIVTPTPCLKIRYMHEGLEEKEVGWVKRVENAVLEKCYKDGARILHIYVDRSSKEGCVYVKCDSLESAGKAFRSMYGNWFDCRLVIVKFVTLARYHQRLPDALRCIEPLQPDSKMPSSLNWVAENND